MAASLEEYVKGWMAIHLLRQWEPLREHVGPDPGRHVFDMSVGYDLAGISTDKVSCLHRRASSMPNQRSIGCVPPIPEPFKSMADHRFRIRGSPTPSPFRPSTDALPRRSTRSPATS